MPSNTATVLFLTTNGLDKLDPSLVNSQRWVRLLEHIVHPLDYSYSDVHTELILDNQAYSAVNTKNPCVVKYTPTDYFLSLPCVETVKIPLTDDRIAKLFLEESSMSSATYQIPVSDFLLPKYVLDFEKSDLDCCRPDTWEHLYCSQFVLLFLRFCAMHGILDMPTDKLYYLSPSYVNSRTCTPAHLRHILRLMFQ